MTTKLAATPSELLIASLSERATREGLSMREQLRQIGCSYAQWMALLRGEQRFSASLMAQIVRRYPEYLASVIDILRKDPSFDKGNVSELDHAA